MAERIRVLLDPSAVQDRPVVEMHGINYPGVPRIGDSYVIETDDKYYEYEVTNVVWRLRSTLSKGQEFTVDIILGNRRDTNGSS